MGIITKLKSNVRFKKALFISIIVLFGIVIFSFPAFSFSPFLYLLTWVFTVLYLVSIAIYLFLFGKIQIDFITLSFLGFCGVVLLGSAFSGFKGFVITPIALSIIGLISYQLFSFERKFCKYLFLASYVAICCFTFLFLIHYRTQFLSFSWTRLGNDFGDINDISIFFGLGFLLAFYSSFFSKKIWIIIPSIVMLPLLFLCGMSTGSKIFILFVLVHQF